jgi:hypothetical protein
MGRGRKGERNGIGMEEEEKRRKDKWRVKL